jgi:hypothetical protein
MGTSTPGRKSAL